MPAVVAISSENDANQSLSLIRRRVNMMTALCGTVSVSSLSLAFIFGAKHGYLVYAGATAAILLRNQRESLREIGHWIKDRYYLAKEVAAEYYARKTMHRTTRRGGPANEERTSPMQVETPLSPQEVTGSLEELGAASLANCLVSGFAFTIASIGVLGDMD